MSSEPNPEPDRQRLILYVGQDIAGHWLVQDSTRKLEGRFVSYGAALSYAQAERQIYNARVEVASAPLTPLVPFTPVGRDECVLARAA
jgi:hypothetical protein